jgi:hypothetical protein
LYHTLVVIQNYLAVAYLNGLEAQAIKKYLLLLVLIVPALPLILNPLLSMSISVVLEELFIAELVLSSK